MDLRQSRNRNTLSIANLTYGVDNNFHLFTYFPSRRLIIERGTVVAPKYKVLVFPYLTGGLTPSPRVTPPPPRSPSPSARRSTPLSSTKPTPTTALGSAHSPDSSSPENSSAQPIKSALLKVPQGLAQARGHHRAVLGTKIEAFRGRGHVDYFGSQDLEDFITVIDGRPSLAR